MRSTARRVAELEYEARGPVSVHAIKVHEQDDQRARETAIDCYGRALSNRDEARKEKPGRF